MKYIIFEDANFQVFPIIFSELMDHVTVATKFEGLIAMSAGKCDAQFNCISGSVSMNILFSNEQSVKDEITLDQFKDFRV